MAYAVSVAGTPEEVFGNLGKVLAVRLTLRKNYIMRPSIDILAYI